jgi:hypothetical protein
MKNTHIGLRQELASWFNIALPRSRAHAREPSRNTPCRRDLALACACASPYCARKAVVVVAAAVRGGVLAPSALPRVKKREEKTPSLAISSYPPPSHVNGEKHKQFLHRKQTSSGQGGLGAHLSAEFSLDTILSHASPPPRRGCVSAAARAAPRRRLTLAAPHGPRPTLRAALACPCRAHLLPPRHDPSTPPPPRRAQRRKAKSVATERALPLRRRRPTVPTAAVPPGMKEASYHESAATCATTATRMRK